MDLNSSVWCNLVFEGKNKKYGAYYLRKTSSRRHLYALIIVMTGVVCATTILTLFFLFRTNRENIVDLKPVNLSDLIAMQAIYDVQSPLPEKETPLKIEIKKQTPPKIVADEEVIEPLDQEEIQKIPEIIADNSTDSISAGDHTQKLLEQSSPEERQVAYVLDRTNQDKELQAIQTSVLRYIYLNIKYPAVAYKQKIKGRVTYSFVINTDGSISDITLVKGVYIFLDEEVLRVIQAMPAQVSLKKDGKPVRAKIYLPVEFTL